jgi:Rieske Fe-S protein
MQRRGFIGGLSAGTCLPAGETLAAVRAFVGAAVVCAGPAAARDAAAASAASSGAAAAPTAGRRDAAAAPAPSAGAQPGLQSSPEQVALRSYARTLLVDELDRPLAASSLVADVNYVFNYPYQGTPAFLLNLGRAVGPQSLQTKAGSGYRWPGGVGRGRSVVAFSAICAHQLVYPTKDISFISFRPGKSERSEHRRVIHCCADNSQYDPAEGARVLAGPAEQPLCAIVLEHDARADTLSAVGTLGGELFDAFFRKYAFRLQLDVGARATQASGARSVVSELKRYCKQPVAC